MVGAASRRSRAVESNHAVRAHETRWAPAPWVELGRVQHAPLALWRCTRPACLGRQARASQLLNRRIGWTTTIGLAYPDSGPARICRCA